MSITGTNGTSYDINGLTISGVSGATYQLDQSLASFDGEGIGYQCDGSNDNFSIVSLVNNFFASDDGNKRMRLIITGKAGGNPVMNGDNFFDFPSANPYNKQIELDFTGCTLPDLVIPTAGYTYFNFNGNKDITVVGAKCKITANQTLLSSTAWTSGFSNGGKVSNCTSAIVLNHNPGPPAYDACFKDMDTAEGCEAYFASYSPSSSLSTGAFNSCGKVINCAVLDTPGEILANTVCGFYNCGIVIGCTGSVFASSIARMFSDCKILVGCEGYAYANPNNSSVFYASSSTSNAVQISNCRAPLKTVAGHSAGKGIVIDGTTSGAKYTLTGNATHDAITTHSAGGSNYFVAGNIII